MENRKILSALIVLAFVTVPFLGILTVTPTAKALEVKEGNVTKTKEGKTDMNLTWDSSSVGKPLVMNLSLNKGWSIDSATVGISSQPYITDPGTQWETINYPDRPRMDVGRNGDDWIWPGTFGHQSQFANTSDSEEPAFSSKDTQYLYVPLPVGAKVQDIKFNVNNTASGQYEYRMTVGSSTKTVWYKSSIGFSKGPFIATKDANQGNVNINSVCVDHLDFLFDTYKDIVAVGNAGQVFTMMHNKDEPTGYTPTPVPIIVGQVNQTTNTVPDILACALGDYNQDITNELAVSSSDGKMYVLGNDGMGNFQSGFKIDTGMPSYIQSVTFGDVNNDGWGDLVGGYVRGQFFVSTYDNTKTMFKPAYQIKAGTGAMNGIAVVDTDIDGNNDLVGANADRNWWITKNTGKGAYPWNAAVPVKSGGSALTSLAVTDLNFDNSPDLIAGSLDGSLYVAYNIGGNNYDTPVALRGGLDTMKSIASGDLDLDGDVDVLGLNADGWIYSFKNEFGTLQDGQQLLNVGKDQNCIALGDLNNDNALDIIVGGNKGVTIYYNNLGPFAQTIGLNDTGVLKNEVQNYLNTFHGKEDDYDAYGNLIVDVPLKLASTYPGTLKFDHVNVTYTYEATVDIKTALSLYVKANQERANSQGFVDVPIQFMTDSMGKLHIGDIAIHYKETLQAIIDSPLPGAVYNMSTPVELTGHSNFDLFCKLDGFIYTWTVDGRMVNTGCDLKASPKDDLGGVGSHNLRLTVAYTPTGEKAYSNVQISLVPDLTANLKVTINLNTNAQYTEDKTVTVSVTVVNTGVINATNIGIKISDGNRPIDSKKVPLIPVGASRPTEVNLTWTPSAGAHTICTSYVPTSVPGQGRSCAQVYVQKKPFDYTIFAIILIVIIVMALVGYFGIKYAQGAHDRRAKKEKAEMEAKLKAQMQADFADIYGAAGPPAVGTDPYATGQQPYSGYDQYSGGTAYGDTSPAYQTFKCPRCGQPTAELGVQCFACDAKDSVKYAEEAIKEVKELGIDVDEAETLLNNAKNSLKAGNYEVALEESEEAEDIASEVKERYDKAFSMISAEGAETAAERRRKRLERRKAAREKKDHMDSISGEGAEAAPAPPEGGEGAPPADKQ